MVLGDMKKTLPILVLELNLIKSAFVGSVDVEENTMKKQFYVWNF